MDVQFCSLISRDVTGGFYCIVLRIKAARDAVRSGFANGPFPFPRHNVLALAWHPLPPQQFSPNVLYDTTLATRGYRVVGVDPTGSAAALEQITGHADPQCVDLERPRKLACGT